MKKQLSGVPWTDRDMGHGTGAYVECVTRERDCIVKIIIYVK